jgi:DNA-directed RNA polymerase subunit RPC12/RpoP
MNEMNRIAYVLVLILAIFLILMGGIFMIASGIENIVTGVAMLGVAAILFFFLYRSERIEASRPRLISQTFNVKMGGSGQLEQKRLTCRSCGAPLEDKDLKVVQGGVVVTCQYCGSVYALEEAPKW